MNKDTGEHYIYLFERIVTKYISRDGIENLMGFLRTETDFFYAPCSTRFHLAEEYGLVAHSVNVFNYFKNLCDMYYPDFDKESVAICSLFHDVCKYHCYEPVKKSRKTGRTLPNGKPEWEDYFGYDYVEEFPYGHGEKSVYILGKFLKLSDVEAMAIRWHMGFSDTYYKGGSYTVSNAIDKYPIISVLHCADLLAASGENKNLQCGGYLNEIF